jgi:hypothetical protein
MLEPEWKFVILVTVIVCAFSALWRYARRRSKPLVTIYRDASPEQRRDLDAALDQDLDLDSRMRPMPRWEIGIFLVGAGYLVYSAVNKG